MRRQKKVFKDFFASMFFPVVENFHIGHCQPNYENRGVHCYNLRLLM